MIFSGLTWDVSVATTTDRDEDGFQRAQLDGEGRGGSKFFEQQHTFGFYSRPRDADTDDDGNVDEGGACTMFVAKDGDAWYGFLGTDPRYVQLIPLVQPGGSLQYAVVRDGADIRCPYAMIDGDDGTYQLYIPLAPKIDPATGELGGPRAHQFTVGYDGDGEEYIAISHAEGQGIVMTDDGGMWLKNAAGDAGVIIDDEGVAINGNLTVGGGFTSGGAAAQPMPTYLGMQAILTALTAALKLSPQDPTLLALIAAFEAPTTYTVTTKGI